MKPRHQTDSGRLTIRRWSVDCFVPADHPSPREARTRIEAVLEGRLAERCRDSIARILPANDPSVWRIRRLNLNLAFADRDQSEDHLARWAGDQLAGAVARVIAQGEVADLVLRFASRADFLARFVADLAAGRAWGKWYYLEFEGLSALPVHLAITEALIREPETCASCLCELARSSGLEEVLQAITERDAQRIFQTCFESPTIPGAGAELNAWITRVLQLWAESPLRPVAAHEARSRDSLRLLAQVALKIPDAELDANVFAAINCLLEIRRIIAALRAPSKIVQFLDALANRKPDAALSLVHQAGLEILPDALSAFSTAVDGDIHWAEQAVGVLASDDSQGKAAASVGEFFVSSFAGIFLLGPSLLQARLGEIAEALTRDWEKPERSAAWFRQFVLLKCLGRARAADATHDPAIRLLAGVSSASFPVDLPERHLVAGDLVQQILAEAEIPLESAAIAIDEQTHFALADAWPEARISSELDEAGSLVARVVLRHFARRLIGFHTAGPEHLYQNFLAGIGSVQISEATLEVRLPRSPLAIVLQLSGVGNQTYALPWLNGKEVCLLLPTE